VPAIRTMALSSFDLLPSSLVVRKLVGRENPNWSTIVVPVFSGEDNQQGV
jgi:hypothetical protein